MRLRATFTEGMTVCVCICGCLFVWVDRIENREVKREVKREIESARVRN